MRSLLLCLPAAVAVVSTELPAQVPVWSVDARPVTVIGTTDGPDESQLLKVHAVHRLPDGRVVVANGKPLEVRLYDASGKFLRRVSRSGGGPGEIQYSAELLEWPGDSVAVYSLGGHRLMLFSPEGALVRETPASDAAPTMHVTLYRRVFLPWRDEASARCARATVEALPASSALREMRADGMGRYWVRNAGGTDWTVFAWNGTAVGKVRLPASLEVYEFDGDLIVGKVRDADDVEQVQVLRVHAPPGGGTVPCDNSVEPIPQVSGPRVDEFKAAVRNAMTAGEAFYARAARYPQNWDDLRSTSYDRPPDSDFQILHTGARGWSAMITDQKSTLTCVFAIGDGAFPGWPDGVLSCGP
jgi:hypothetical protein